MLIRLFYAMIGVLVLSVLFVGFGSSITTPQLSKIGGDDNVVVPATDADVTKITWTESNNEFTSATVTVKNTDSISHAFEICMISKAGASFSDTAGTSPDCASTGSISASATGSVTITFVIALNAANVDAANLSIEQTT